LRYLFISEATIFSGLPPIIRTKAVDDRGDDPVHQTTESTRGHPASDLRPSSEHDGPRAGCGLLRDGLSESAHDTAGFSRTRAPGGPPHVRHSRLPLLCPGRWDQGISLRPKSRPLRLFFHQRSRNRPIMALLSLKFWRNSSVKFPLRKIRSSPRSIF